MSWNDVKSFLREGKLVLPPERAALGQCLSYWGFTDGSEPREHGVAQLTVENGKLCAYGAFEDHDIFNDAREDNAETWKLGDVFEMFFQIHGHEDYYEFHTTPEKIRLQLHMKDYRTFRSVPWEERLCDAGLVVDSEIHRDENLWLAALSIPMAAIGLTEELVSESTFAFAHYSYTHGQPKPEITSTMVFPTTVHFPPLWHRIIQKAGKVNKG